MKASEKICTLYKYTTLTYLEDIISNQRLFMSDREKFNDPFELLKVDKTTKTVSYEDNIKVLCLTNSYRKKLMWSHYSDKHVGVCLTVQLQSKYVFPICYTSKRLMITNIDNILSKNKMKPKSNLNKEYDMPDKLKVAYVKDSKWLYEKEYRVAVTKDYKDEFIIGNFMKATIKNIYFGVNFDVNKIENKRILELCNEHKIKVSYMHMSENDYSIFPGG